ncbi:MAG: hypothetical protein KDA45_05095, partial [Planctomycetales bacterium]|nr:hypothetical protein [Planctomycetales bacterium]
VFGLFLLALLLGIIFLPTLLARRSVVVPLINQYAGLAPLQIELESVQAGWFSPVRAQGIQVLDGQGKTLARIGQAVTDKGILGWLRDTTHLGTLSLQQFEAAIVAAEGTTNIEQALQPLVEQFTAPSETTDDPAQPPMSGTLQFVDAKFMLLEAQRPERWVVAVPQLTIELPREGQLIGPIELQASVAEVSGAAPQSRGSIAAAIQQTTGSEAFELRARLDQVPVDFWHVLHARFPEIPVQEMQGRLSATLSGNMVDANRWSFDVQQFQSQGLVVTAPELVGADEAKLKLMSAAGRVSLADAVLRIDGAQLNCDFAQATASATVPWPMVLPTASNPFLAGAVFHAQGAVDLPGLAQAAESLLPLRQETQLVAGSAQFAFSQDLGAQGKPTSRAKLQLAGLQAISAGQPLSWKDPLTIEIAADQGAPSGLQVGAMATAEFCQLQAGGTIEAGQLKGNVDLDLLQQRLSQYIELPIRTMTGSANVDASWKMIAENTVQASGQLTTTPLVIASTSGGQIQEPAWNGDFTATAQLLSGSPQQIDQAALTLKSSNEQLTIDLKEPLSLTAATPGTATVPPAAFTFNLVGDLANWKRRGTMWLSEPPELDVKGHLELAVEGRIDLEHVEILQANWRSQPLELSTPQMSFAEPQMVGNFKGRVDTNDITRLVVEKLEVQSTSFSLGARDSAPDGGDGSRVGQAMFLVDLDRLMKSMQGATNAADASVLPPATQYHASGRVQGQLAWQVSPQAATVEIKADGQNFSLLSAAPGALAPTPLWQEPQMTTMVKGNWTAETGAVTIDSLQLQLPWMTYNGNLAYRTQDEIATIEMQGQAVYDSEQLTQRLGPMTGSQVQLYGQQTVPIEVTWTGSSDPQRSVLAGLKAATRIGWEQARVAGIAVGKADVPVRITAGQLTTAAEFPVSGGQLRWDVSSDLTADELVLNQKPMTVLENVAITEQMCQDWLKYVTPLLAEATSVDGRLSLRLDQALLTPADPKKQTIAGQLVIHNATVGPGPLSNQVITLVKQVDAIRKKDFTQAVSTQKIWLNMPQQTIDFQMSDGRVSHRNVNVKIGDAQLSTSGSVSVDGQLEMLTTMPIPDDWVEKSPLLSGMRGQALQFPVRGTLSQPQMDTELLRQFGRQTVQNAASGLLQQGLSRGLEKLFGAPSTPPAQPPSGP